jgi:hypothetical protein
MTIAAWVKLSDLTQRSSGVVGVSTDEAVNAPVFSSIVFSEFNSQRWENGSDNGVRHFSPAFVEGSTDWVHMTITYANNDISVYRNGALIGQATSFSPAVFESPAYFYTGVRFITPACGAACYLKGAVDDARLYGRALSASEVFRVYESGKLTP